MAELDRSNPFAFAGESARDVFNSRTPEETNQVQNFLNAISLYRSMADAVRTDTVPQQITKEYTTTPKEASEDEKMLAELVLQLPSFSFRGGMVDRAKDRIGKELKSAYGDTSATFNSNPIRAAYDDTSGSMSRGGFTDNYSSFIPSDAVDNVKPADNKTDMTSVVTTALDQGASNAKGKNNKGVLDSLLGSINWARLLDVAAQPSFLTPGVSMATGAALGAQQLTQREKEAALSQQEANVEARKYQDTLNQRNIANALSARNTQINQQSEERLQKTARDRNKIGLNDKNAVQIMFDNVFRIINSSNVPEQFKGVKRVDKPFFDVTKWNPADIVDWDSSELIMNSGEEFDTTKLTNRVLPSVIREYNKQIEAGNSDPDIESIALQVLLGNNDQSQSKEPSKDIKNAPPNTLIINSRID